MPSKSPSQHRLMEAVAHNPAFAKKTGIPQKVGKEFSKADEAGRGLNKALALAIKAWSASSDKASEGNNRKAPAAKASALRPEISWCVFFM